MVPAWICATVAITGAPVAGTNAYDVVRNTSDRRAVADWLTSDINNLLERAGLPHSTSSNLGGILQALDKIFTSGELLEVTVVVTFEDGSQAVYVFSTDGPVDGRAEYLPKQSFDANGNRIRETGEGLRVGDRFNFDRVDGNQDVQEFLDYMCLVVTCTVSHYASLVTECSWDGHELHCETNAP